MGIRIHRAMGWGMSWSDFAQLTTLKQENGDGSKYWLNHLLYETFDEVKGEQLSIPLEEVREQSKGPELSIMERHLLSTKFTTWASEEREFGSATNLYFSPGYDDINYIGFLPALYLRKKWYRYNDDLDYAFATNSVDTDAPITDVTKFLKFNHYPWTNSLMHLDGSHKPWEHFTLLEKQDDWAPAVPAEIRWYLKKLGVMDDTGINKLRPMVSQWWC